MRALRRCGGCDKITRDGKTISLRLDGHFLGDVVVCGSCRYSIAEPLEKLIRRAAKVTA